MEGVGEPRLGMEEEAERKQATSGEPGLVASTEEGLEGEGEGCRGVGEGSAA